MPSPHGGQDRVSTKTKLAGELVVLGQIVVRIREGAGLKQSVVAQRLGLPASHLAKIEAGSRRMDVVELVHLAEAMGVEPEEIVRELRDQLREAREP